MARGSIAELMTYVGCLSLRRDIMCDQCKAVASDIGELSDELKTIKFYQVDVRKHAMLSIALSNTELPVVVFIKNGIDFLTLTTDISLLSIREGPAKYSGRPPNAPDGISLKLCTWSLGSHVVIPNIYSDHAGRWSSYGILRHAGMGFNAYRDQGAVEDGVKNVVWLASRAELKRRQHLLQQVDIGHDNLARRVTIWLGAYK
ncbi:hypothetical protein IFM46972_11161 [Aspergillus udagawae]|uniref:Thioredoxin domain-containing protein n=1 Tax=Aspergillus udagawae TaxID=91492 RepID=A0A8H3SFK4_9EURO|nr:hypothetical protein IFM46972_11161 [Aspergillus udagawae]